MNVRRADFDLAALYAALDAERQARSLTWSAVMREINAASGRIGPRPISASTIKGLATRRVAEGDGVLQMLRWLKRTPESFIPGVNSDNREAGLLPDAPGLLLRFDATTIHAALDARRIARGLSWPQVAAEIGGTTASSLTHLRHGGRVNFPAVMRLCHWLDAQAVEFVHLSPL